MSHRIFTPGLLALSLFGAATSAAEPAHGVDEEAPSESVDAALEAALKGDSWALVSRDRALDKEAGYASRYVFDDGIGSCSMGFELTDDASLFWQDCGELGTGGPIVLRNAPGECSCDDSGCDCDGGSGGGGGGISLLCLRECYAGCASLYAVCIDAWPVEECRERQEACEWDCIDDCRVPG